jgi:hypothetical protein
VTTAPAPVPEAAADDLAALALVLGRRFAAGATLWCVAPGAPHHARHVAVEFVHPVVVGARSLPAVAVTEGDDPVEAVRLLARPGDVVLAIGPGDDAALARLLRRGPAWGVHTVLLAEDPVAAPAADHVVRVGEADAGGALLAYHLLWELTQVVFEHPGLLRGPGPAPGADTAAGGAGEACATCSDEGRLAEVRRLADARTAVVVAGGQEERVDTSVVGGVGPGDLVLVHAGLAVAVVEGAGRP